VKENFYKEYKEGQSSMFHSKCIRETSNVSSPAKEYKIDKATFDAKRLRKDLPLISPKAVELFKKIKEVDEQDLKEKGRLYKHFIFCDVPSKLYGSTFLAACFKAFGYTLGMNPSHALLSDSVLEKTKYNNFFLLSSLSLYDKPFLVGTKKKILAKYNARPENIHGRQARFILLDAGFKEGIDLFDVRYVHIFEPSVTDADQKQVIGRATRTCGQRGLAFVPNRGWDLEVFIYDIAVPEEAQASLLGAKTLYELYLKSLNINVAEKVFSDDLQKTVIQGSVDYLLNKKVHGFQTNDDDDDADEKPLLMRSIEVATPSTPGISGFRTLSTAPSTAPSTVPSSASGGKRRRLSERSSKYTAYSATPDDDDDSADEDANGSSSYHSANTASKTILAERESEKEAVEKEAELVVGAKTKKNKKKKKETKKKIRKGKQFKKTNKKKPPKRTRKWLQVEDVKSSLTLAHNRLDKKSKSKSHMKPPLSPRLTNHPLSPLTLKPSPLLTNPLTPSSLKPHSPPRYYPEEVKSDFSGISRNKGHTPRYYPEEVNSDFSGISRNKGHTPRYYPEEVNSDFSGISRNKGHTPRYYPEEVKSDFSGISRNKGHTQAPLPSPLFYDQDVESLGLSGVSVNKGVIQTHTPGEKRTFVQEENVSNYTVPEVPLIRKQNAAHLQAFVEFYFPECRWDNIVIENQCGDDQVQKNAAVSMLEQRQRQRQRQQEGGEGGVPPPNLLKFNPTQMFVSEYFKPSTFAKGLLLWHSVGTGKTCSAIAAATKNFDPAGYTILWVTRTTLKADIWKNMFEQVCNEQIRERIRRGQVIPKDQSKRMRLLSNAWKIKPISYKQFTNLISGSNEFYKELVKRNGRADPLKKTLIIIDEAHKLFGPSDLSSLEKPDTRLLKKAIMHSYLTSGEASVRMLLMTATPITESPMELVQLVNLLKPPEDQLPETFEEFSQKFLTKDGTFTGSGKKAFQNSISGLVSYLNREFDMRQFAQPHISMVYAPLTDVKSALTMAALGSGGGKKGATAKEKIKNNFEDQKKRLKNHPLLHLTKKRLIDVWGKRCKTAKCRKSLDPWITKAVDEAAALKKKVMDEVEQQEKEALKHSSTSTGILTSLLTQCRDTSRTSLPVAQPYYDANREIEKEIKLLESQRTEAPDAKTKKLFKTRIDEKKKSIEQNLKTVQRLVKEEQARKKQVEKEKEAQRKDWIEDLENAMWDQEDRIQQEMGPRLQTLQKEVMEHISIQEEPRDDEEIKRERVVENMGVTGRPQGPVTTISVTDTYTDEKGNNLFRFETIRDAHVDLSKNTVALLQQLAKLVGLNGYSKMKKPELVQSLQSRIVFM
jgi:hypothetical protein